MIKNGFVDLQVNGYKGYRFTMPDLTIDQIHHITSHLVQCGTIAYCPTLTTNRRAIFKRNLSLLVKAMRDDKELAGHILGFHLEGPFISPVEGARGAHQTRYIRKPSVELFKRFQDWADGHIVFLTLAPEIKGAGPLVEYCVKNGVKVAMGHHFAEDEVMAKAVKAGVSAATHLGNGLPNMINRHRNPLWWQLAGDDISGTFITDGHHLPADFIKAALRAKTVSRFMVVSDSVTLAGMPPGTYEHLGNKLVLAPSGRISFADTPYLAGSSANMLQCMNHLAALKLLSEKELWQVGRENPLRYLGKKPAALDKIKGPRVEFRNNRFRVKP